MPSVDLKGVFDRVWEMVDAYRSNTGHSPSKDGMAIMLHTETWKSFQEHEADFKSYVAAKEIMACPVVTSDTMPPQEAFLVMSSTSPLLQHKSGVKKKPKPKITLSLGAPSPLGLKIKSWPSNASGVYVHGGGGGMAVTVGGGSGGGVSYVNMPKNKWPHMKTPIPENTEHYAELAKLLGSHESSFYYGIKNMIQLDTHHYEVTLGGNGFSIIAISDMWNGGVKKPTIEEMEGCVVVTADGQWMLFVAWASNQLEVKKVTPGKLMSGLIKQAIPMMSGHFKMAEGNQAYYGYKGSDGHMVFKFKKHLPPNPFVPKAEKVTPTAGVVEHDGLKDLYGDKLDSVLKAWTAPPGETTFKKAVEEGLTSGEIQEVLKEANHLTFSVSDLCTCPGATHAGDPGTDPLCPHHGTQAKKKATTD